MPPFLVIVSFTATNAYFINRIPFSALRGLAVQQYRGEPLTSKVMTISLVDYAYPANNASLIAKIPS